MITIMEQEDKVYVCSLCDSELELWEDSICGQCEKDNGWEEDNYSSKKYDEEDFYNN